jgi:hypothetical protein
MEPKDYSTLRSILKKEQGEKIAPYIFKVSDTKAIKQYLDKEGITCEVYQEERLEKFHKRASIEPFPEKSRKRQKL